MEPSRFGPYTITTRLGRGGMGSVYEAVDQATGAAVAVKTLAAHMGDDPGMRKRFAAEIEALKALRHPGIVRLIAFGEEDGQPYFAMELVRGRSLEQLLRAGRRFDWRETVDVALAITRALKSAHDHGVVHRDLKPGNLLFPDDPDAAAPVKLADFGIARLFGDAAHTSAGTVVGTAEYMAPEQAAGRPVDARADLYALGLVMYAMLAGRPPFQGGAVADVLARQQTETPPPVASRAAGVPPQLDALVARLLAKDPAARPASALAVGRQLTAIAASEVAREGPLAPPAEIDLLALTREFTRAGSAATAALPLPATDLEIAPDGVTRPAGQQAAAPAAVTFTDPDGHPNASGVGNRFTTLADIEQAGRRESAARHRRERWLRGSLAIALAAAVGWGCVLVFRPLTADELFARIQQVADAPEGDLRDVRPLIDTFLARHGDDPRAATVRGLDERLELDALEKRAGRRPARDAVIEPLERDYRAAMAREQESPLACLAALDGILTLYRDRTSAGDRETALWLALARRQVDRLQPRAAQERAADVERADTALAEAVRLGTAAEAAANPTARAALADRRRDILTAIVDLYGQKPHVAEQVRAARTLLAPP